MELIGADSAMESSGDHCNASTDDELSQRQWHGLIENQKNFVNSVSSSETTEARMEESCQMAEAACETELELFESSDLRNVLSLDVWKSSFSDEERQVLTGFLPALKEELVEETVEQLLAGATFHFGSPLFDFLEQLQAGVLQPAVALQRDQFTCLQRQKHYHSVKEYHNRMVNMFAEMQKLWENHPDAEIDQRIEIWKSRKHSNQKPQIHQQSTKKPAVKILHKNQCGSQSPRKLQEFKFKIVEERDAAISHKRGKELSGNAEATEVGNHNVILEGVTRNVKRSCRPGPKGVLKLRDSKVRTPVDHSLVKLSVRTKLSLTPSQQPAKVISGKGFSETDKCSSSKCKEAAIRGKRAGLLKMQKYKKGDKHEVVQINERKSSVHSEELRWLSQSKNIGHKSSDRKHKYSSSSKQDRATLECLHGLEGGCKLSTEVDKFQEVTRTVQSGLRKKRPFKRKVVTLLTFEPLKKRAKPETKIVPKKHAKEERGLEDHSDEVDVKTESLENSDEQHNLEQMTHFVRKSGDSKRPYCRKRSKDDLTAAGTVNQNFKKEKIPATMSGCMDWKLGLADEDIPKMPLQTFGTKCGRTLKLAKKKDTDELKSQAQGSLNLQINISPPIKPLKDTSSFSVKSSKKPVPATSQSKSSTFPFSIIHLFTAVRLALISELVPTSCELHENGRFGCTTNRMRSETSLSVIKREASESSDGSRAIPIQNYDLSRHARSEPFVPVARTCPVHFPEIVKRIQNNPGDSRLPSSQDLLEDVVRGALKVLSSRIAPSGAKAWTPLTTYDKGARAWSWIGPLPGDSLQDPWEVQILPEAWGVPQKILDKMEETFSNWYKHGQETLKQILEFPLPPPPPMPAVLDEKDRFKVLRTQKSLITIPPTSADARAYFRMEELIRYSLPNRSFTYTAADGQKSVVAPLRICGIKLSSKARDHFMLKSDRPPHVTILCLVRDAAARLPQSIGTRADVCTLMRDSQFIIEDVSDAHVNQVVSGALDRLHYERDPCVRFDGDRKLWVYLHSHRHEEDFEDDGTSSTKRWKKPKKEPSDSSGLAKKACENGSTPSPEESNVNHINLEMNSPDGFDIAENSAIYSVGSAELVYNKSSSLSSPRVLGTSMNRGMADGEGIPFLELPPSLHNQNGSWPTMRRQELPWQQQAHHFQSSQQAAAAASSVLPDPLQIE